MKQANDIAKKVVDKFENTKQYPVGKAQQQVIDALGITVKVNGHSHAQQIFDEIGISVSSKRNGRTSVPVVSKTSIGGGFNAYGEGEESFSLSNRVDLSSISQWMA